MQMMLPALRADFELREKYTYTHESPLPCPIAAFGGIDDQRVGRSGIKAWGRQTSAEFTLRMLPGDHFFLMDSRPLLVEAISQELAAYLAGAA
jgi:medium-chain acyl-[acyl-carrier-protein] hydrolase